MEKEKYISGSTLFGIMEYWNNGIMLTRWLGFNMVFALVICLTGISIHAQDTLGISGLQTIGVRSINLDVNSSKFNEYRDIRDGFFIPQVSLDFLNSKDSWFISVDGENLLLDNQFIRAQLGDYGNRWNLFIISNKTPKRISNKAQTPFLQPANGLFTVPDKVPIINDGNDATGTTSLVPTRAQMAVNDSLIGTYVQKYLHPVSLDVQRELVAATLDLPRLGAISLNLTYSDERRTGNRIGYGTLGDRPPRTLNVQLPEPVEYITREIQADAEYAIPQFQVHLSYLFSIFENRTDNITWENIYFRPAGEADYISTVAGTPRNVSNFGRRSLAPDNFYHNVSLSFGLNLPLDSRLTASAAVGFMMQDEQLLTYSYSSLGGDIGATGDGLAWNNLNKLPRQTADAKIRTTRFDADYNITLIDHFNLRPFIRYYDLKNETPAAQWRYVTQDAAGTDGNVNYLNYRRNLAYSFNKLNFGMDARYYFTFWRTSINIGFTRENIDRDFREANTTENIFEGRIRLKPIKMLSLSVGYLYGDRNADTYNYKVTSHSYWYSFETGAVTDDNPQFLFANHPDLRKFDVNDRLRNELNISVGLSLMENLDLIASFRNRNYDYDSDVNPVAPLAGTNVPLEDPEDEFALTPGQQLGLLKEDGRNINISANYIPSERLSINIFADREDIDSDIRGLVFSEMLRNDPHNAASQAPTALGTWASSKGLYNSTTEQMTNTIGAGFNYELVPGKIKFYADYSMSLSEIELQYSGYGSDPAFLGVNWETFDFGFNNPTTIKYDIYTLNISLEYQLFTKFSLGLHYMFSRYLIQDWVEGAEGAWVEQVGSENFLHDTSRDNRWGNRLVNLGLYLAPDYKAHVGYMTMTYQL